MNKDNKKEKAPFWLILLPIGLLLFWVGEPLYYLLTSNWQGVINYVFWVGLTLLLLFLYEHYERNK